MFRRRSVYLKVLLGLLAVYLLAGFFLAPVIVRQFVLPSVQKSLVPTLAVETIRTNPLTLSTTLEGITLEPAEEDGRLLAVERVYARVSITSVFRFHPVVANITIDTPEVDLVRNAEGGVNWAGITVPSEESEEPPSDELPAFSLGRLEINEGVINLVDRTPEQAFNQRLGPTSFVVEDLTTRGSEPGEVRLTALTPDGGELTWNGGLHPAALSSEGEIAVTDLPLTEGSAYLREFFGLDLTSGLLSLQLAYRGGLEEGGQPQLQLSDASLTLREIDLRDATGEAPLLRLGSIEATGGSFDLAAREATVDQVNLVNPYVHASRTEAGEINWLQLLERFQPANSGEAGSTPAEDTAAPDAGEPFAWSLGGVEMTEATLHWEDAMQPEVPATDFLVESLTVGAVDSSLSAPVEVVSNGALSTGGLLRLEASIVPQPLSGTVSTTISRLEPASFSPYWTETVPIRWAAGTIESESRAELSEVEGAPAVVARTTTRLEGLELVDAASGDALLTGGSIALEEAVFDQPAMRLDIARIALSDLAGRFVREAAEAAAAESDAEETGETASPPEEASATASAEGTETADDGEATSAELPIEISVEEIVLSGSEFTFLDRSLDEPVEIRTETIEATIRALSSESESAAEVELTANVGGSAPLRLTGTINPFPASRSADLELLFESFNLTRVSPYAARHIGRRISEGTLRLDVSNSLAGSQLDGEIEILIDELDVSQRVDSPEAMNLPIDLAVTLFKNGQGEIRLPLPISGDLSNPSFSIAGIVGSAFRNLIGKAATSPLRFLAGTLNVGATGEGEEEADPSFLPFEPGSAELDADAPQITVLRTIHEERPLVRFALVGQFADSDREQLTTEQLEERLAAVERPPSPEAAASAPAAASGAEPPLDREDRLRLLAREMGVVTDAAGPPLPLSTLEQRVREQLEISPEALRDLARRRAEAVQAALREAGVADEAISPREVPAEARERPGVAIDVPQ
ncbi:MAG: DUF748 domain-containing protein [Opitutales bacterium]